MSASLLRFSSLDNRPFVLLKTMDQWAQQPTDPSAPTTTDSISIRAAAKTKANITLRIHITSLAAQTVPALWDPH
jgi:hypothetical protein